MKYQTYPKNYLIERDRHGHTRTIRGEADAEKLHQIKLEALTCPWITLWLYEIYLHDDCDCGRNPDSHHRPNCASTPIYRQMVEDHGNPWAMYKEFPSF